MAPYGRRLLFAAVLLSLTSCAVLDGRQGAGVGLPDRQRDALLAGISSWQAQGRLAIRYSRKSWQMKFKWCQAAADDYRLLLTGPWGRTLARLEQWPSQARLQRPDETDLFAPEAATLLSRAFGWEVPVDQLQDWLLARPAVRDGVFWDAQGRPAVLQQDGWRVDYKRYRQRDAVSLPVNLTIRQQRGIRIGVVIDSWEAAPGEKVDCL